MVCVHRMVLVFWFLCVFGTMWPEHMFAIEGQSIEGNAIQIANKEVEALGLKLPDWKPETGETIQEEWRRIRLLRRDLLLDDPSLQEYLDNQERLLAGKDFLAVRYLHKDSAKPNVKHGVMWVFIDKEVGNVLLVIPPGH
jgi:hypothetical protein